MANKRPKPEEIVTKLRQVELLPRGERPLCGLQRQHLERQVKVRKGPRSALLLAFPRPHLWHHA